MNTETKITISILCIILWIAILFVGFQRPTRAEVITICEELIKANSNTIFDKKNAGQLESCLYTLIEIERGEAHPWELEPHLHWLVDRNEQRIEEKNEKFREE